MLEATILLAVIVRDHELESLAEPRARSRRGSRCTRPRRCPAGVDSRSLAFRAVLSESYKVLVAEQIADSGVELLRERFAVDVGVDWSAEELAERIGVYDGILIRSATQLTAELIGRAGNLKVIGRAGIGVDNVDVEAATQARDRGGECAAVEHRGGGGAHDRVDVGVGAQHPAGACVVDGGAVGAVAVRRGGGV